MGYMVSAAQSERVDWEAGLVRSLSLALLAILAGLSWTACAHAADRFGPVKKSIQNLIARGDAPSVAIAVAKGNRILWEQGFGLANREKDIPATADTMYSVASVSKPITATALMTLVQAGKIDLDRPIDDYLGTAKLTARIGNADDATVRRVANHSAGLPEHFQFFYENEPWRPPSPDVTIARYGILYSAPGTDFQYSNLGYGILGYVISRVSGERFGDYVEHAVFEKLGMDHSSVGWNPKLSRLEAVGYGSDGEPIPLFETDHDGASAMYMSAHDLVRFGMFSLKQHLRDQSAILPDSMIDAMERPTIDEGDGARYGVGWETRKVGAYTMLGHTGGMPGVAAELRLVPSQKLTIVVLANTQNYGHLVRVIADQITSIMLPKWEAPGPAAVIQAPFLPPADLVGVWKGKISTYQGDIPFTLAVSGDGEIRVKLGNQLETLVNDAHVSPNGYLRGALMGSLGIDDAARRPYSLGIDLEIRSDGSLSGAVTARAQSNGVSPTHGLYPSVDGRPAPTKIQNSAFILSQWAELKKNR